MKGDASSYLRGWFDHMAPAYDHLEFLLGKVRPQVVEMAAAPQGARVLDAATGTGSQALAFAVTGCEVTGIDLSGRMLSFARRKDREGRISFIEADASEMPFTEGSFDVSVISFALHDMPGPMREAALGELVRVTDPGGTVMIVDYEIPQGLLHKLFMRLMLYCCENAYVPAYFHFDLEGALRGLDLYIEEKVHVLRGVGMILKCRKPGSTV